MTANRKPRRSRPSAAQIENFWKSLGRAAKELPELRDRLQEAIRRDGAPDNTVNSGWPTSHPSSYGSDVSFGSVGESPVERAVMARLEARDGADPIREHTDGALEALEQAVVAIQRLRSELAMIDLASSPDFGGLLR